MARHIQAAKRNAIGMTEILRRHDLFSRPGGHQLTFTKKPDLMRMAKGVVKIMAAHDDSDPGLHQFTQHTIKSRLLRHIQAIHRLIKQQKLTGGVDLRMDLQNNRRRSASAA